MTVKRSESRGARLLRELECAYRQLSPERQRSVIDALHEVCDQPISPELHIPGGFAETAAASL